MTSSIPATSETYAQATRVASSVRALIGSQSSYRLENSAEMHALARTHTERLATALWALLEPLDDLDMVLDLVAGHIAVEPVPASPAGSTG